MRQVWVERESVFMKKLIDKYDKYLRAISENNIKLSETINGRRGSTVFGTTTTGKNVTFSFLEPTFTGFMNWLKTGDLY